jgi:hypothetical protein
MTAFILFLLFLAACFGAYSFALFHGINEVEQYIQYFFAADGIAWVGGGLFLALGVSDAVKDEKVVSNLILIPRLLAFVYGIKNIVVLPALVTVSYFFAEIHDFWGPVDLGDMPHWMSCVDGNSSNCKAYGSRTRLIEIPFTILLALLALICYIWFSIVLFNWALFGWKKTNEGWRKTA